MSTTLTPLDFVLLGLYLAGTLGVGLWIGRSIRTGEDFFLGGRKLPWWAVGMSLVATDIGGPDIIGVGGAAYDHGMAVANFEWIGCVPAMIVGALVFIPFFWRMGVATIPEYLEKRFDVRVRTALSICWQIFMACNLGVMLLASARMMSELFGWGETTCILATAVLVGAYTIVGGLAAVVYTDMIQCTVMIAGCMGVLVLGLVELGGPTAFWEQLEPAQKALVLPVDTDTPFPWTGILFGLAMILSPAYWIGNQAIVQRSLGAKSAFQAQAAYVWGAVLKSLIPVIIVGPGLVAVLLYPELDQADHAFPQLVAGLLPAGLRGIFLAAFLAALMSSVDSYLNSASTLVAHDIYRRFVAPEADAVAMLRVGRGVTAILVIWSIACAMVMARLDEGIYTIFQTLMSFFQGPALAVLLAGTLWKRATGTGALVGFLGGLVTTVGQFLLNNDAVCSWLGLRPLFQIDEPFLYYSIWGFLVAGGLLVTVSLLTRREPDEKTSLTVLR
tara:strand:- start:4990 stop:6492 length:1503 start_codon:yes stop_codon:yes gene_type:complete